jgi:hypothetical protein
MAQLALAISNTAFISRKPLFVYTAPRTRSGLKRLTEGSIELGMNRRVG